ncbi:glycosyltransferase family 39 protein [Antrihabitans cavernicola]|uniref:Mannosyltransferase n=1 Tax=Antrihabitans cavernicola TaxID=2495913 RepID=A0A5A7SET7_9NOCA|nr:glycosyltransferase family 39 protein [Spelaeibacter cavernicola]KAA0024608.1 mannosyltransferase [Spelaeibacter cavernicola]
MRASGGIAAGLGVLAAVLGAAFSWRPSFWYDEAATVYVSQRSLPDLARLLAHQDAVHGVYYLSMHFWFRLFGASEFSARLPSAIAVGVAVAGVVVLAELVADRRAAVLSGLICAVLPRLTWAAVEARGYALTAAVAVWLTVVLLVALRRGRWFWWVLYAVGVAAAIVVFMDLATLVCAHALTVLVLRRRALLPFAGAAVVGGLLALPAILEMNEQSGQVGWIPAMNATVLRTVLVYPWFVGTAGAAVLAAVIVVYGLIASRSYRTSELLAVAVPWAVLPIVLLVAYSLAAEPMYLDRYVTFTAPAVALLVGGAIAAVGHNRLGTVALIVAVVAPSVGAYLAQRTPYAKPSGMDYSAVADYMADNAHPGDCVLFAEKSAFTPTSARVAENIAPSAFAGLQDPGKGKSAVALGWLWDEQLPIAAVADKLGSCSVLWYVGDVERSEPATIRHTSNEVWHLPPYHFEDSKDYHELVTLGFTVDESHQFNVSQVVRLRRS